MSQFFWEECGRSYVTRFPTRFGRFTASIRVLGSKARGDVRFRVEEVFGQGTACEWQETLDGAIEMAEFIILREAKALWPAVQKARNKK